MLISGFRNCLNTRICLLQHNNIIVKLFDTVCNLILLNTYDCLFTSCFHYHYLLLHLKNSVETLLQDLPLLLHWHEQRYCCVPLSHQTNWGTISLLLFSIIFLWLPLAWIEFVCIFPPVCNKILSFDRLKQKSMPQWKVAVVRTSQFVKWFFFGIGCIAGVK